MTASCAACPIRRCCSPRLREAGILKQPGEARGRREQVLAELANLCERKKVV
jgi:hypothetical protein